jgi:tellurite resistance protein TerB
MGFWDDIKGAVSSGFKSLSDEVSKYKNQPFLDAVLAAAAMVAAADGKVDSSEKKKLMSFVTNNELLSVFEPAVVIETFKKYLDIVERDPDFGPTECMAVVKKLKGKPEADIAISVCCAIGKADGDFDKDEKEIVKQMCVALGIDPAQFSL